jgi:hypothetical protein
MLEDMDRTIKKDNPVNLATFGTEDTRWRQKKTLTRIMAAYVRKVYDNDNNIIHRSEAP